MPGSPEPSSPEPSSPVPSSPEPSSPTLPPETPGSLVAGDSIPAVEIVPGSSVPATEEHGNGPDKVASIAGPAPNAIVKDATSADAGDKARVFGPQTAPETEATSEAIFDLDSLTSTVPLTPVPPVPLPCELLLALPDEEPLPTPSAGQAGELPMSVAPSMPQTGSTELLPGVDDTAGKIADLSVPKGVTAPDQSVIHPEIPPTDKPSSPSETPRKDRKTGGWKATPLERRRLIVIDEKAPINR